MIVKPFFADDIFISYARKDSSTYASGLADELTRRGFSCFIDRLGTEANPELPRSLRRKVRGCAMLVVVGTSWSGTRNSIKDEILEFKKTKRPIVPIDIDGSIHEAAWYEDIEGIAPEPEKNPRALDDGNPTPAVISRIEKAFRYKRRNERLRRWTIATATILVLLIAVSVAAARKAISEVANAREASAEASRAQGDAERAKGAAEQARNDAVAAKAEAEQARAEAKTAKSDAALAKREADTASRKAEEQTQLAQAAAIRAREAAANADKQQAIAVGRQAATIADSRRAQSLRLRFEWADKWQNSVLLSVEAAKRLSAQGLPPAESEQALRDSLDLLPRAVQRFQHAHAVRAALLTPDGKYLITKEDDGFMRVWESAGHKQVSETKLDGKVIFNPDRTLMAMEGKGGRASIWRLPQGEPVCKNEWKSPEAELCKEQTTKYSSLKFSPDGRYLAADRLTAGSSAGDEPSRSIVVWNMQNGHRLSQVKYQGDLMSIAVGPADDLLAVSLTRPGKQDAGSDPKRPVKAGQQEDNFLQIWKVKSPVAELVRETLVPPREITRRRCRGASAYGPLIDLSFSPDGRLLAANTGFHASILEVSSAQEATYIIGPNRDPEQVQRCEDIERIIKVEFSADGKSLGTIGDEGSELTWDVSSGKKISQESYFRSALDGDWVTPYAAIKDEGGSRVMDIRTGKEVARIMQDLVVEGDYAPEAERLVVFSGTRVWLYDTGSAQETRRVAYSGGGYISNVSADGRYVPLIDDSRVLVWDAANAREISRLEHGSVVFYGVAFSSDGSQIATVTRDNSLHVWETDTGREIWQLKDLSTTVKDENNETQWNVASLYFSPRGKFLVLEVRDTGDTADSIHVWEVSTRREIASARHSHVFKGATYKNVQVSFTNDDRLLELQRGENLRVLDTATSNVVATLPQEEGAGRVIFSPDNKLLVRSHKGMVEVLKILGGGELYKLPIAGEILDYLFTSDGKFLVAVSSDGRKAGVILEVATGQRVELNVEKPVTKIKFSPNEKYLVTQSDPGEDKKVEVNMWELASGRKLPRYLSQGWIGEVVFSPDESRVAIFAPEVQAVRVLDPNTGRTETELDIDGPVEKVTFSPDGESIAVISGELVHVWELRTSREIARLRHRGRVLSTTFVAGGHELATVSEDLIARVWILEKDKLIQRACESLTRNLRPEEWQRAFGGEKPRLTCPNLPVASAKRTSEEP